MRRVAVVSLGCKVNQYDGEALSGALENRGVRRVTDLEEADVVIVNTCTVTNRADADARRVIRKVRKTNPGARVVVTGCLAQRDPQSVADLDGVDLVVGNADKGDLPILLEGGERGALPLRSLEETEDVFMAPTAGPGPGRSRAFLKIQEGCGQRCSYCIVPTVRGPERSLPGTMAVEEIRRLVGLGFPEVVLCGVHLGSWGQDRGETLAGLLSRVHRMEGTFRVRLSSIEPWDVDAELLDMVAGPGRVAPHLHLPLQSGCDATLARMGRPYAAREFAELLEMARSRRSDLTVGTDLIVGFPGEDDREFDQTMQFLRSQPIDLVHVFPYSPREGTPAARLAPPPQRIAKERLREVQGIFSERRERWLARHVGRRLEVVTLGRDAGGTRALAGSYAPVRIEDQVPAARLTEVEAVAVEGGVVVGHAKSGHGL